MTTPDTPKQSSRDKILIAAATMIGENPAARLSVRAVAARAGVNTGSLRHHFPTQRDLYDAVLAGIYSIVVPDEAMRDTTRDPQVRLVETLRHAIDLTGLGPTARETWRATFASFIDGEPSEDARIAYLALERAGRRRFETVLDALTDEGALPAGDNAARARLLSTVVNGMSIERALPAEEGHIAFETQTLTAVVAGIFTPAVADEQGKPAS